MRLYRVRSIDEVLDVIKENFTHLSAEQVDLLNAGGRVAAENIYATEDVPAFDRSTVDGYAVKAADTFGASESIPALLNLSGQVKMGEKADVLPPSAVIYVPTGGMLPEGADAVVMIEHTELLDDLLNLYKQAAPGDGVIKKGEDVSCGFLVLKQGSVLRAAEIGLLASLGIAEIKVTKKPVVAVLSTGDEIQPWDSPKLEIGQIRDSNAPAIMELAKQAGAEVFYGGIVKDDYDVLRTKAEELLTKSDMLVLSGGGSVGVKDFTCRLLGELGGSLLVEGVAVQPGKPTLMASCNGKAILGLPGHPVSALNIFNLVGKAVLAQMLGQAESLWQPTVKAVLTHNIASQPGRTDMVRVVLSLDSECNIQATPVFGRSGLLRTLKEADGIVTVAANTEGILAGKTVEVVLIS
ncbi:MAG: molybdopterin molybdotransferase MoeA [Clostridia bacterium]|nr:molybdopterin molybdotransferase MoeA [Clostridia bacterium]